MSQHPAVADDTFETVTKNDVAEKRATNITYAAIVAILGGWATSSALFGLAGFIVPAVAAVPVIFVIMVLLTLG
ncbi:hypothetical protein [Profundibacter sp.]|uniref:hypothetical protein n=1 Tax=Profundibacter sp. TaxID=3101071 RepID=UPI003D0A03E7